MTTHAVSRMGYLLPNPAFLLLSVGFQLLLTCLKANYVTLFCEHRIIYIFHIFS